MSRPASTHQVEPSPVPFSGRISARNSDPSEDDVALAFTHRHGATLRFDHDAGRWFEWDETRWRPDNKHRAFTYAREIARLHGGAGKANFAAGVERFARADRTHACNADLWDRDPWLLGTPGGTVDLRTGELRPANPGDHITKLTGCAPEEGEPAQWLRFLDEALAGDQDAIRFLQQFLGYCLTGDTREHAMLFGHGIGGTGKSVTFNTFARIMGDYAMTSAMETFTASTNERHSTELARLRGARLVTANETEHGRAWAESRIKAITGGDTITARFMRQDDFEFRPQFKLIIIGNHAPQLKNPDEAMRRRFNILAFNIKPAQPDPLLEHKLKAEHGRILAWAIAGCLDWRRDGLVRPNKVTDATADYFAEEDLLGQWLAQRCDVAPANWDIPSRLYADWSSFVRSCGEKPDSNTLFGRKLTSRGFRGDDRGAVRKRIGLSLKQSAQD